MPKPGAAWPRYRWLAGAAAVVLVLVIVWALLVPGADWLAHHDVGSARGPVLATARDAARGRLLTLGAGLLAAGALVFTARSFTLSREGQVTDRYTKAIEQLGSDKLDVRIGGIYALERIGRDSARDHPTVMEVLTAFIREHSREPWPVNGNGAQDGEKKTRPDVQATITVVGRRDPARDVQRIDLAGADLTRAYLSGATLPGATLPGADLTRATLTGADLTHAYLTGATLSSADLSSADLTRASLTGATLSGADLTHATLTGAGFTGADLTRAYLAGADLTRATLPGATLSGATLSRATLTDAKLSGADLTGATLTDAKLSGADLTGATLTDAKLSGADLTGATLTDAKLSGADLTGASWPDGVPVPEGWVADSDTGRLERTE